MHSTTTHVTHAVVTCKILVLLWSSPNNSSSAWSLINEAKNYLWHLSHWKNSLAWLTFNEPLPNKFIVEQLHLAHTFPVFPKAVWWSGLVPRASLSRDSNFLCDQWRTDNSQCILMSWPLNLPPSIYSNMLMGYIAVKCNKKCFQLRTKWWAKWVMLCLLPLRRIVKGCMIYYYYYIWYINFRCHVLVVKGHLLHAAYSVKYWWD